MDRPLELAFHNMKPSAELETLIHERAARLEQLESHIVGCRVTIDLQNHADRSGGIPEVRIEIQLPGQSLTVSHTHSKAKNAQVAIRDAFDAVAMQIKEYKARKTGEMKHQARPGNAAAE